MDVWHALQVLRRRKLLIALCTVLALLLTLVALRPSTQRWVSSAKLMVSWPQTISNSGNGEGPYFRPAILTQLFICEEFLTRVAKKAEYSGTWTQLRDSLQIKNPTLEGWGGSGGATLIEVIVTADQAQLTEKLCDTVATEFTHYLPEVSGREYTSNRKFLEALVDEAHDRLTKGEAQALAWQEKHGSTELNAKDGNYTTALAKLQSDRAEYAAQVAQLRQCISDMQSGSIPWDQVDAKNNAVIGNLRQRLAEEQLKLTNLKHVYQPGNPQILRQAATVQDIETAMASEARSQMKSLLPQKEGELQDASRKLAAAEAGLASMRQSSSLAKSHLEFLQVTRQIEMWNKNYQELQAQLYSARVAEQVARREGAVSILNNPSPAAPVGGSAPGLRRSLPMALPFCLGFALFCALAVEYLSSLLRVRPRIEEAMGLPIIGVISRLPRPVSEGWESMRGQRYSRKPETEAAVQAASSNEISGNGSTHED